MCAAVKATNINLQNEPLYERNTLYNLETNSFFIHGEVDSGDIMRNKISVLMLWWLAIIKVFQTTAQP